MMVIYRFRPAAMPYSSYTEYAQTFRSKLVQRGASMAISALIAVLLGWVVIFS